MLLPGFRREGAPHPIVAEAIAGAVHRVVLQGFIRGDMRQVAALGPTLAWVALTPFVGADQAVRVIESHLTESRLRAAGTQRAPADGHTRRPRNAAGLRRLRRAG